MNVNKKYLIISIVSMLALIIGVSIAYFTIELVGNEKNIVVNSKELKIIFTDTDEITGNNIAPGWSTSKTFTVQNLSESTYKYDIQIEDLINTFVTTGFLQYKIESTNSGYNTNDAWVDVPKSAIATDTTIAKGVSIGVGVTQTYTLYLRYPDSEENQDDDQGKIFSGRLKIVENIPTLVEQLLELNPTRSTRSSFSDVFTTSNTGTLYTTTNTEDGSTVYYFAGNALNNWVKFGKCTSSSYNCTVGQDLYWRIIRTNEDIEDGGVRLLYAGSGSVAATNAYISDTYWSGSTSLAGLSVYVGYMWGTSGSLANNRTNQTVHSNTPADKINTWYAATFNNSSDVNSKDSDGNLLTNYINPSAIYCNDRSIGSTNVSSDSTTYFNGARSRLATTNPTPSYACGANTQGYGHYFEGSPSIADKFTGSATNSSSTTIGNGLLGSTPAALMTADEVVFAGGKVNSNSQAWFYYNAASNPGSIVGNSYRWWTMSPGFTNDKPSYEQAYEYMVFGFQTPGELWAGPDVGVHRSAAVRPVISLKASVLWDDGDGSPSSPYEVKLD